MPNRRTKNTFLDSFCAFCVLCVVAWINSLAEYCWCWWRNVPSGIIIQKKTICQQINDSTRNYLLNELSNCKSLIPERRIFCVCWFLFRRFHLLLQANCHLDDILLFSQVLFHSVVLSQIWHLRAAHLLVRCRRVRLDLDHLKDLSSPPRSVGIRCVVPIQKVERRGRLVCGSDLYTGNFASRWM